MMHQGRHMRRGRENDLEESSLISSLIFATLTKSKASIPRFAGGTRRRGNLGTAQ